MQNLYTQDEEKELEGRERADIRLHLEEIYDPYSLLKKFSDTTNEIRLNPTPEGLELQIGGAGDRGYG